MGLLRTIKYSKNALTELRYKLPVLQTVKTDEYPILVYEMRFSIYEFILANTLNIKLELNEDFFLNIIFL